MTFTHIATIAGAIVLAMLVPWPITLSVVAFLIYRDHQQQVTAAREAATEIFRGKIDASRRK